MCSDAFTVLGQLGFVTKPLGRTGRATFTRADVVGCLAEGNKKAREKWHGNDAGQLEIPDASDLDVAKGYRASLHREALAPRGAEDEGDTVAVNKVAAKVAERSCDAPTPVRQTRASLTPRSAAASPAVGKVPLYDRYAVEESRYGLPPRSPRSPPTPKLTNKKLLN